MPVGSVPAETTAPRERSSSSRRTWARPWVAVGIAAAVFAGMLLLLAVVRLPAGGTGLGGVGGALLDVVVVLAPLAAAVVVATLVASEDRRIGPATGLRPWRWTDLLTGLAVGLALRAVMELFLPTTGSLGGPLGAITAAAVVTAAASVLIAPVVEELYFRGLIQRALEEGLDRAPRAVAAVTALAVSTVAFVVLHVASFVAPTPGQIAAWGLVGLGCGILTLSTRRLGAAIVAHVVYNAIGVALLIW